MELSNNFMKLNDAAKVTPFSAYALREGCKAKKIPHIVLGNTHFVNVPAMLEQFDKESRSVTAPPAPRYGRGSRGGKAYA